MLCKEESLTEAFETIYKDNQSKIYRFLYKMCADAQLSEELTQETFYRAFLSFGKFRGDCEIFTWLATIAKYEYFRFLKKSKRGGFENVSLDCIVTQCVDTQASTAMDQIVQHELHERVRQILKQLPQKNTDVVILRLYADMTFRQIADTLKITESSAKVLYFRAKNMLKEKLSDEFEL